MKIYFITDVSVENQEEGLTGLNVKNRQTSILFIEKPGAKKWIEKYMKVKNK